MKRSHKFHPVVILLTSLVISLSLVFFSSVQAYTSPINSTPELIEIIKSLREQIKLLNQQILDLQSRVEKTEEEVQVVKAELKLTKTLRKGESSDEVKQLQEFLKQFPDIYPEGIVSGFFGSLTETAVKRFQEKQGIESIGIVGPKTIQKLNEFSVSGTPAIPAIPATPATPAIPASPSQPLVSPTIIPKLASPSFSPTPVAQPATPAVPAIPATPGQPVTSSPTPTPTPSSVVIPPTAPTDLVINKGTTLHLNPPAVNYSTRFNYTLASDTKSFRVYLKRPNSANFAPYTYDAQLPLSQGNESIASPFLRRTDSSSWYWWPADEFLPNADLSRFGEYKIYVTAVNSAGVESVPSETKTIRIYAPPVISSPAEGSTVSTKPTITFTTGDSSISSQDYAVYIYKVNGTVIWSNGLAATNFTYSGTDLNSNDNPHRLVVHSYAAAPNFPYWYSPFSQITFSVATPTPSSSAPAGALLANDGSWCYVSDDTLDGYGYKPDPYKSGYCQDNTGSYYESCGGGILTEQYCDVRLTVVGSEFQYSHVNCASYRHACANTCSNSACVAVVPEPQKTNFFGLIIKGVFRFLGR